jgi:hypothetical protein
MIKKSNKIFIIIFSCILFLVAFETVAQGVEILKNAELKITSISENKILGGSIFVMGESLPNVAVLLSVRDEKNTFAYSIKTSSDAEGNWSAEFSQLLKSGKYYIEAVAQDRDGLLSLPVKSELINLKGPFSLIIGIFSFLVIFLLAGFVGGWYASKSAEIKRYRRILISQRDTVAAYNILKNDVEAALKSLIGGQASEVKINEMEFFLKRVRENLEKMNKYVVKGIEIISKYDIIDKIENRRAKESKLNS